MTDKGETKEAGVAPGGFEKYFNACKQGEAEDIKMMLDEGFRDYDAGFAVCCAEGQVGAARVFIDYPLDWDTALGAACFTGDRALVGEIIKKGGKNWAEAARVAALGGHQDLVQDMIERAQEDDRVPEEARERYQEKIMGMVAREAAKGGHETLLVYAMACLEAKYEDNPEELTQVKQEVLEQLAAGGHSELLWGPETDPALSTFETPLSYGDFKGVDWEKAFMMACMNKQKELAAQIAIRKKILNWQEWLFGACITGDIFWAEKMIGKLRERDDIGLKDHLRWGLQLALSRGEMNMIRFMFEALKNFEAKKDDEDDATT